MANKQFEFANKWFKFYGGEFLADPKMASLTPAERSCWLTLLCLASMSSKVGVIEFLTVDVLLQKSGIVFDPYHPEDWNNNLGVLQKFAKMRMVELTEEGFVIVSNWEKRQEMALTNAERQQRYRDNKADSNARYNDSNARVEKRRVEKSSNTEVQAPTQKTFKELMVEAKILDLKQDEDLQSEEINKFHDYWTEKNPNGKKERWQMQKVFDVKRRWATWMKNKANFSGFKKKESPEPYIPKFNPKYEEKISEEQRMKNLARLKAMRESMGNKFNLSK